MAPALHQIQDNPRKVHIVMKSAAGKLKGPGSANLHNAELNVRPRLKAPALLTIWPGSMAPDLASGWHEGPGEVARLAHRL